MNRTRMLGASLGVVLAFGALTWLWSMTDGTHAAEHGRYESALRDLQRLDRTLNQDVLRARVQLLNTYDPLVVTRVRIDAAREELAIEPAFLSDSNRRPLARAVIAHARLLAQKGRLVEAFKSQNAVLKNSLRYLPTLAAEAAVTADRERPESELGADIRALLGQVLLYDLTSNEALAADIAAEASRVGSRRGLLTPAAAHQLDLLVVHVRTIVRVKPEVDGLVRDILSTPVAAGEDAVERAYLTAYGHAQDRAARFQAALYAVCVGLGGLVAFAFHRLARALAALRRSNDTLERKVQERTASLDARNEAVRRVLDNVEQGLVTVDRSGRLAVERSPALDRWVPAEGVGAAPFVWEWVSAIDPRAGAWIRLAWEELFLDELPFEVVVDQLPKRLSDGSRHLGLELRPILRAASDPSGPGASGGPVASVLVVVTDITDRVERERAEGESRDLLAAVERILADRPAFLEFLEEAEAIVGRLAAPARGSRSQLFRDVHTLKGNAGQFGLDALAAECHALESRLVDGGSDLADYDPAPLRQAWQTFAARIQPILGPATHGHVDLSAAEYGALEASIADGQPRADILRTMERLRHEPAERRLGQFAQQALCQAARQGKPSLDVHVAADNVRFDRQRLTSFWSSFVHVIRNAVDHGIEDSPAERVTAGKPARAALHLRAWEDDDGLVLEVRDDGRGIQWERVAARAADMGLPAATRDDLVAALFADGLSTKDEVTELSGRGVGAGVVLRAVQALGGTLHLDSEPGRGTTLRFRIPHPDQALAA